MDSRRRSAPKAESSSDVTRYRGLGQASALAAAIGVVIAVGLSGRDALRGAPGPLSRSHQQAGLSCQQCHGGERDAPTKAACVRCHGGREHTRPGHAARAQAGQLTCASCHREHRDHGGVRFEVDGTISRYGVGEAMVVARPEQARDRGLGYRPPAPITVVAVPAGVCARCHQIDDPRDPSSPCVLAEQRELGDRRPTTCFDEHRTIAAIDATQPISRDPAWEAAREVLAAFPQAPARSGAQARNPLWWMLGAVLLGLIFWLLTRSVAAARSRRRAQRERANAASVAPPRERKLPTINTSTCIGCYACVDACPYDVLAIRDYVATVARPADCCGLTLCEQRCPNGSLRMGDGQPVTDSPLADDDLQSSDVPGIYLAGDVTGLPLIRNAINQGAHAARTVARSLAATPAKKRSAAGIDRDVADVVDVADVDVAIVGAGPAGLSAALAIQDAGLTYVVLEQHTVAASVSSFPRGKLVFDQPLELPLIGDLWLQEATKEELLGQWLRIVRRQGLQIRERARVTSIAPLPSEYRSESASRVSAPDGFVISLAASADVEARTTGHGSGALTVRARRVIVAIGRRGSPRRLPVEIPEAWTDRVFYSLADARSFAGRAVLVVGLGDVAMEAAIALSRQPDTRVVVSYRGSEFRRGKARTIETFKRRLDAGVITLHFATEVAHLAVGQARLRGPDGPIHVACDAVFVLIGAIPASGLLRDFGLHIGAAPRATSAGEDAGSSIDGDRGQ